MAPSFSEVGEMEMARKTTETTGGPELPTPPEVVKRQAEMLEQLIERNIEMVDFLRARLEKDRKLVTEITEADRPTEVMAKLAAFWQQAWSDYAAEVAQATAKNIEFLSRVRASSAEGGDGRS